MLGLNGATPTITVDFLDIQGNLALVLETTIHHGGLLRRPQVESTYVLATRDETGEFFPSEVLGSDQEYASAVMRAEVSASRYSIWTSEYFGF